MRHGSDGLSFLFRPVLVLGTLILLWGLPGCSDQLGSAAGSDPHADLRERLEVGPEREIHQITIGGRGDEEHVVPTLLPVAAGDIVVFTTVDGRVHTVGFPETGLAPDVALFLERTSQLQSPPLT
ncbi:MAG: hypothetical protein ACOC8K_08120, partial [Gemmatimonadota bacterium]